MGGWAGGGPAPVVVLHSHSDLTLAQTPSRRIRSAGGPRGCLLLKYRRGSWLTAGAAPVESVPHGR